mmetsp:Transcript_423/g.961  ORF Transcript_423/g.961 Transcript_423/m.961 type:complete len:225 (+) Transcript_423:916-1590(+)
MDDSREVVVCQDHVGGLLSDLSACDAHGDADIRLLQSRCIIHPIAGHSCDLAETLQDFHDNLFVFWLGSGENSTLDFSLIHDCLQDLHSLLIRHFLELFPCERLSFGAALVDEDAQIGRNGLSCDLVVTCDHQDADSCHSALLNRLLALRSRRVDDAYHTNESQSSLHLCELRRVLELRMCGMRGAIVFVETQLCQVELRCQSQSSERLLRQIHHLCLHCCLGI